MPLYDCQCPNCGRVTEQLLAREEEPGKCSGCGTVTERKATQVPNFSLKGGGWYSDGYSKGSGRKK